MTTGKRLAIEARVAGLYLPALDLYLDPHHPVRAAFVSHAHADHATAATGEGTETVFASPETLALIDVRRGERPPIRDARRLEWGEPIDLAIVASEGGGTARLSIAPAGHILGAAQLVVDHPGGRLVYTGDYRTGPGETHKTGAPVACDELLIESTYGLPIFRFPDRAKVISDLIDFCRRELAAGHSPMVVAYSLGKSQELVKLMVDAGLPIVAHGAVFKLCEAYEALGVKLGVAEGKVRAYAEARAPKRARRKPANDDGLEEPPAVLLVPPSAQTMMTRVLKPSCVVYVSGWALLDAALEQRRADAAFVLSDHADHDDLLATVKKSGARHVIATHGDANVFARVLASRGVDATALEAPAIDTPESEVAT